MMPCMRSSLAAATIAALTVAGAAEARAQSPFDAEARVAPQFMQYHVQSPRNETISELAIPAFVLIPVSERFTIDVGTSYARARVASENSVSEINGLTDTQVRGNLTLGSDFVILTAGLNLPTGRGSVSLDQFTAASRIGNDFLAFPISSMGSGFAATGGIAIARPVGDWNLGFGAALRHSNSYEPFAFNDTTTLRFTPGPEYRLRAGIDRALGAGRLALGLTFSTFGQDDAGGVRYSTGNRLIAQTSYASNWAGHDFVVGGYDVLRSPGTYASGDPAGRENIANLFAQMGIPAGGTTFEPSIELRHWLQNVPGTATSVAGGGTATTAAYSQSSYLATAGVRTHAQVGGLTIYPSVGYTVGSMAMPDASNAVTHAGLTGFRAQLAMRAQPFGQ